MNLRQAEEYLLGLELFGMRFGLDRMHKLMTVLGLPQRRFASVHVVGTNGKTSTVRFCAAILQRHGLRTGSYTSPHLRSFRERIEVGEQAISEADFAAAVARAAHAAELVNRTLEPEDRVTQFEALTAAAYHELARRGVEVAVIEAGLGGRFDATNVIPSKVQVLTNVGLEHTRWLGPTVGDIAEEKLAVVRDHATLVTPKALPDEVEGVAQRVLAERRARRVRAAPALGGFQRANFALAATATSAFLGRQLDQAAVRAAESETRIPGRMDLVARDPLTIYDGAHNPSGARALAEALPEVVRERRPRVAVISVLEDKDAAGMLRELAPRFDRFVFTRCVNPRALSPGTLETLADKLAGPPSETVADPGAAVERGRALAGRVGAVVATGSIYLVADLVREAGDARASTL
ncbi:MAG TPA: cyanophycin synthetase [Thermoleophilaceae bacterium]|nr:cyanophycin synthetase [Thermoleophilaceae bacterium]